MDIPPEGPCDTTWLPRSLVNSYVSAAGGPAARARAERFLRDRVVAHSSLTDLPYEEGRCWTRPVPRTHGRYLHGLLFLADWHRTVLSGVSPETGVPPDSPDPRVVAADVVLTWEKTVTSASEPPDMAFHDETTAQRLMQIVTLLDDHGSFLDEQRRDGLTDVAARTAWLLLDEGFYGGANNHGMFQDLALLRYAARPDVGSGPPQRHAADVALGRLETYFSECFTRDGVHVENSPGYHFMVARFLRDVVPVMARLDPRRGERLRTIYEAAERFGVHSVLPDGRISPLGDTKVVVLADTTHRSTFSGAEFRYAVTRGSRGRRPRERTVVFPEGGYAMHRTAWGDPNAYVATFKAAYLSQFHHHGDDLALTIFGRGRWLLGEAGPYGYDYHEPMTRYAFSQFAHNTVVVDGRSLPRVDATPGGVSLVDHTPERGEAFLDLVGTNERFAHARHDRRVQVREPNGDLQVTVTDTVEHDDDDEHDHEIFWHVGPGVETFLRSHGAELYAGDTKVLELTWSAETAVRTSMVSPRSGRGARAMRFPAFGKHEDGSVIRVATRGRRLDLVTTIRSGSWFYHDWGIASPSSAWTTAAGNVPVHYLTERVQDAQHLVVAFSAMAPDGSFTYNYKRLLDGLPVHRLFILDDFGEGGAYYYADHRSTHIRDDVEHVIRSAMESLCVPAERVAFVGSSKGGTAALIHGAALGVAKVVVGAPQVRIGAHVSANRPNIERFMAGGNSPEDRLWLDEIVPREAARMPHQTRLDLFVGSRDHHLRNHVPHLVEALDRSGHPGWEVHVREGLNHAEIGVPFRDFAATQLRAWTGLDAPHQSVTLQARRGGAVVACSGIDAGSSVAVHLYRGRDLVEKVPYRRGAQEFAFEDLLPGMYRARVFVRTGTGKPEIHVTTRMRLPRGRDGSAGT